MQDDKDRPSTETTATPQPPKGADMKDLVTPGRNADIEADAQTEEAVPGGEMPGADEADEPANPDDPEEAQSPT